MIFNKMTYYIVAVLAGALGVAAGATNPVSPFATHRAAKEVALVSGWFKQHPSYAIQIHWTGLSTDVRQTICHYTSSDVPTLYIQSEYRTPYSLDTVTYRDQHYGVVSYIPSLRSFIIEPTHVVTKVGNSFINVPLLSALSSRVAAIKDSVLKFTLDPQKCVAHGIFLPPYAVIASIQLTFDAKTGKPEQCLERVNDDSTYGNISRISTTKSQVTRIMPRVPTNLRASQVISVHDALATQTIHVDPLRSHSAVFVCLIMAFDIVMVLGIWYVVSSKVRMREST